MTITDCVKILEAKAKYYEASESPYGLGYAAGIRTSLGYIEKIGVEDEDVLISLRQIKEYIEKKEGVPKQIVFTGSETIHHYYDDHPDMWIILDKEVDVKTVYFNDKYGLLINGSYNIDTNVLLWDEEVSNGKISAVGALNGILIMKIKREKIDITTKVIKEILGILEN